MPRSNRKSIFKTLLMRDLIFIHQKSLCMTEIKAGNFKLVGIEAKGYWYSPGGNEWSFW